MQARRRRWIINAGLLAVAGTLSLLLIFEPGKAPPAPAPTLASLIPGEITRLRIELPERPVIELAKRGDTRWDIIAPIQAPGEAPRVQTLAFIPQLPAADPIAAGSRDLKPFGLAPPQALLMLNDTRVEFGDTHPMDHRRYVRTGAQIFLLEDSHYHLMHAGVAGFISRRLAPEGARIEGISWPKGNLLRAEQEGEWRFEPPLEGVSTERLRAAAGLWASESALWAASSAPPAANAAALPRLEIRLKDQPPVVYEIVSEEPELVLRHTGLRIDFHISSHSAKTLLLK
jgi:hypothetical protein